MTTVILIRTVPPVSSIAMLMSAPLVAPDSIAAGRVSSLACAGTLVQSFATDSISTFTASSPSLHTETGLSSVTREGYITPAQTHAGVPVTVATLKQQTCDKYTLPAHVFSAPVVKHTNAPHVAPTTQDATLATAGSLRLVSLGGGCGVKSAFVKLGKFGPTLPFDWIKTTVDGVLHFLRSDFTGFFNFTSTKPSLTPGKDIRADYYHVFVHDDPTDGKTQEKYRRRIERLKQIDARSVPVLFVRNAQVTQDNERTDELLQELLTRFGACAKLLVVIDCQKRMQGPVLVEDRPNLLVYFTSTPAGMNGDGAYYITPVQCGIDWVEGRHISAQRLPSVSSIAAQVDPINVNLKQFD